MSWDMVPRKDVVCAHRRLATPSRAHDVADQPGLDAHPRHHGLITAQAAGQRMHALNPHQSLQPIEQDILDEREPRTRDGCAVAVLQQRHHTDGRQAVTAVIQQGPFICGRQGEARGGERRGAVSDDPNFQAPSAPAAFRPVGRAPLGTSRETSELTILLAAADTRPAIVTNPLEQGFREIPGLTEEGGRAAA
jgi:hypothetical protein